MSWSFKAFSRSRSAPAAVAYVTGIILGEKAHARQITDMVRAFAAALGDRFVLIGPIAQSSVHSGVRVLHTTQLGRRGFRQAVAALRALRATDRDSLLFVREILPALILWAFGRRTVLELHQTPVLAARLALRIPVANGLRVLAISHALEADLRNLWPKARDIATAHDGAFLDDYRGITAEQRLAARRTHGVAGNAVVATYTGSLYKGRDAQSFRRMAAEHPEVNFLIAGGRGRLLEELRAYYADLSNVRCVGQQTPADIRVLQSASDILLYPLTRSSPWWRHTSPLKLFEYMAAGRTIVASRIGSVAEIVDESMAYTADGDDEAAMAAAFSRALAAPEVEREEKRRKALATLAKRFDWHRRIAFILERWAAAGAAACVSSPESRIITPLERNRVSEAP